MIFTDELAEMQTLLDQASFQNLEDRHFPKNSKSDIFQRYATLLKDGNICYASIVQANECLFKFFPNNNYPAQVIFSTDPYIAERPHLLQQLSRQLFQFKNRPVESIPEHIQIIANAVTNEHDFSSYTFTFKHKGHASTIYLSPVLFYRKLLPGRKIYGNLIPLIVNSDCTSVMALPKQFWTKKFKLLWFLKKI